MKKAYLIAALAVVLWSCEDNENPSPGLQAPATYEFTRDGQSTVNFQGQLDRRAMLAEIKSEIGKGDKGQTINGALILNMYANAGSPFSEESLNSSGKQLEDKTFPADVNYFKNLINSAAEDSEDFGSTETGAKQGQAGLIERGNSGNFILVNEKGWEYTQFIEKGLMGAVFLHQIFNTYLTDARVGDEVENKITEEGQVYTDMEHHWDEAFGYFGAPVDFPRDGSRENNPDLYWAKYSGPALGADPSELDIYDAIKNAFLKGRTAIVNQDYEVKNEQRDILYDQLELAAAAAALHYINSARNDLTVNDIGSLFHHLSEGYNFVKAIKYSPVKRLSSTQLDELLTVDFGDEGDFWTVGVDDLDNARATLVSVYSELAEVQDDL